MKNIFISSTFIDMQAERDLVQERVLPALREEARKYGDNVGVIDLRWGVDTSTLEKEEGAAKVLKVCLDEIDRSHPYMLIFLGERYGTMMREDQIAKSVWGREDKYTTDDYLKSITALEVEYGALSEKYGELNYCVVCFREPVVHMLDGVEKDLYAEHTEEGKRKLEALKERIKRDLGEEVRLISYSCTWDKSARQLVDFTTNGQPLENVLTNCFVEMFRDDWKEYENLSWQDKEQLAFRALMESKLRSFVGREELLEEYYQSIINGTCPIFLQGEVGSGKTAIMCKIAERLQKEGKNVFRFFAGAGSMSTNAESLVKQMVYYLENLLGVETYFGEQDQVKLETDETTERITIINEKTVQYDDWMERLRDLCYRLPKEEKAYFCIDAVDQLFKDEHIEKLDFFVKITGIQFVASCTDDFVLPMETMVSREVKRIPALSETDAKAVVEKILASYSRNVYATIEEELIKKKSIGNPLYISLLIQRLNMMDADELRKAMTEEEIVALGSRIIKEIPEEIDEAIVAIILDGIDKLSEEKALLYETLQYLAVSRNGLRMSDLQGIFALQKKKLPVLNITLLLKYLDSFFYVQEDDRIDFTHTVIRKGILKELERREEKEETIKEHLKNLDVQDVLRMREGMYFARICKDEEFAKQLIEQVICCNNEGWIREIKNEALADEGAFYCRLIENESEEESVVRDFFLWCLSNLFGIIKEEMQIKLAVGETLIVGFRDINEALKSNKSLRGLSRSYRMMGRTMEALGRVMEARFYYERALEGMIVLHEKCGTQESLRDVASSYDDKGRVLSLLGEESETIIYYDKALKYREELQRKNGSEESLRDLSISYDNLGNYLMDFGRPSESLMYYMKALKKKEQLYENSRSETNLRDLSISCDNVGNALMGLEQVNEALVFFGAALVYAEQLYERSRSEASLRGMAIVCSNKGRALEALGQLSEALEYYEKAMMYRKYLHEKRGIEVSLCDLFISYNNMGYVLSKLGQAREALTYYEKALECAEQLRKKEVNIGNLRNLVVSYNNVGLTLQTLGYGKDARKYYEKMLDYADVLSDYVGMLYADNQIKGKEVYEVYKEILELYESVYEVNDSIPNLRTYVKILRGIYLCSQKLGYEAESVAYLCLAKDEAKKLCERSGLEKDRTLFEEIKNY